MDTSETNIKMCDCPEIQIPHWEKGWKEGDYFWDGSKVCLCGMDYLGVRNLFRDGRNCVRFALRQPLTAVTFEQVSPLSGVEIKEGKYILESLYNGVWLPRQDQLQEMLGDYKITYNLICGHGYGMNEYWSDFGVSGKYWESFTSMEQLWLAFMMLVKYNKIWEVDQWQTR